MQPGDKVEVAAGLVVAEEERAFAADREVEDRVVGDKDYNGGREGARVVTETWRVNREGAGTVNA